MHPRDETTPGTTRRPGPIVIAARRQPVSYLLINHLADRFEIAAVVLERGHPWRLMRRRVRLVGWRIVVGQLLFILWDRAVVGPRSRQRVRALLQGRDVRPPDGRFPTVDVESVNGPEFSALIGEVQPPVVVVSGTGIIARRVLGLGPVFLNIHCGITPTYRGVHGAFWAVVDGRPELAGTTVHIVDPGVDTGAVVAQRRIALDPKWDTYRTLPVKQYLAGLDPMAQAVLHALDGRVQSEVLPLDGSRQWFSPTLSDYWRFTRRLRRLSR